MLKKDGICCSTSRSSHETSHPFERIQTVTVCVSANSMFFCSMKPSAWGFLAFQEGFGFLKYLFLVFVAPGLVKVLERSGPKKSFRENPTSNGFDFLCTVSPKRNT